MLGLILIIASFKWRFLSDYILTMAHISAFMWSIWSCLDSFEFLADYLPFKIACVQTMTCCLLYTGNKIFLVSLPLTQIICYITVLAFKILDDVGQMKNWMFVSLIIQYIAHLIIAIVQNHVNELICDYFTKKKRTTKISL